MHQALEGHSVASREFKVVGQPPFAAAMNIIRP